MTCIHINLYNHRKYKMENKVVTQVIVHHEEDTGPNNGSIKKEGKDDSTGE